MDELRPCLVEILKSLRSQHIHPERIQDLVHGVDIKALLDAILHNEVKFTCGRDAVARAREEISRIVEV